MKVMSSLLGLLALAAGASAVPALRTESQDASALAAAAAASKHSLADGIKQVSTAPEVPVSAKFEFGDDGKLSLSVYTAEKGLGVDAEHNVLKEYSGSPEQAAWKPGVEVFEDVAHVARSAQQQTLMALADLSLADVIEMAEKETGGRVLSVTPMLEGRKAVFVVQVASGSAVTTSRFPLMHAEDDEATEGHEGHEEHEGHERH